MVRPIRLVSCWTRPRYSCQIVWQSIPGARASTGKGVLAKFNLSELWIVQSAILHCVYYHYYHYIIGIMCRSPLVFCHSWFNLICKRLCTISLSLDRSVGTWLYAWWAWQKVAGKTKVVVVVIVLVGGEAVLIVMYRIGLIVLAGEALLIGNTQDRSV